MRYLKFVLICMLVLCMLPMVYAADEEDEEDEEDGFNRDGTDPIIVGNNLIDYGYKVLVMLLFGMAVVAGLHILKDSTRSTTTAESSKGGSTGFKIVKGIIVCIVILLGAPYIINMLL